MSYRKVFDVVVCPFCCKKFKDLDEYDLHAKGAHARVNNNDKI